MKTISDIERIERGLRPAVLAALLIITAGFIPLRADGQSSVASSETDARVRLLPRSFVVTLRLVSQFFPEIVQEVSTGRNPTAVGDPEATRVVIYANHDGSNRVTVSADRYRSLNDAAVAYRQAVDKSKMVPGFSLIPILLNVGQESFAGTITRGEETHVGIGARDGKTIVGITLARFAPTTPDDLINLVTLSRAEDAASHAAGFALSD